MTTNTTTTATGTGVIKCPACLTQTNYLLDGLCLECAYKKLQIEMLKNNNATSNYNKGWICPKCGTVYAPNVNQCNCQNNWHYNPYKITCGDAGGSSSCVTSPNTCINTNITPTHSVTQDMFVSVKQGKEGPG